MTDAERREAIARLEIPVLPEVQDPVVAAYLRKVRQFMVQLHKLLRTP